MIDLIDGIVITNPRKENNKLTCTIKNVSNIAIEGLVKMSDNISDNVFTKLIKLLLGAIENVITDYLLDSKATKAQFQFIESNTMKQKEEVFYIPYILTPKPSPKPQINTPTEE